MFGNNMLVGTLIMHDSNFAKVTGCDEFNVDKTPLAVAALLNSEIIVRHGLEPRVAPEKGH
jgi:hypothetical protein